ncbi:glycoside hydrolase domain-containing protein [Cryobacterium sp. Sr3]|uniref:glycoside hydrolase domain-containing protein n=1 Tax=Cryobacterium sp. Sr3 TaxID=1259194 RepID=UPI00106C6246|nr:glycoside hydrolase domain-containing protein [Cryobacterium sp. Sr3]TFB59626.1 DUF1906 domain-containing protein [Cryobacterium sp. Sr3]
MTDPWVQDVQIHLNQTYSAVPGWVLVEATGVTGWSTMYGLTRALQHELGFTELSENFGPGTFAAVEDIAPIGPTTAPNTKAQRINNIIRAGLYCKGYNGGNGVLDGSYSVMTVEAVKSLRVDMGLSASNGWMTPKVFKALLNMDAYVLLDGGTTQIQTIQRALNNRYIARADFFAIPADGLFSRAVQTALLFALQYEIGMDDGVANGYFGNGTQAGIRAQAHVAEGSTDTIQYFVHLFQAALTFNGYATPFSSTYTAATATVVRAFQAFAKLPVTGTADFVTWASLLVSTGDTSRPATAADCITAITDEYAATLRNAGYDTVGRYLTNYPGPDPTNKKIQPGELATLFAHGFKVFPIFQEGGDAVEYFDESQGRYAGRTAHAAARAYGFPAGTTIYFAADFDAYESEVYNSVVPFFEGIVAEFRDVGDFYKVGVYGSRNTCSIVSEVGLATTSFVSGMSTGYSGNLGYPLPTNWAFDQILEYVEGAGDGAINIDKDVKQGRDPGVSAVTTPATYLDYMDWLQGRAAYYKVAIDPDTSTPENDLVLHYLRQTYNDGSWFLAAGPLNQDFITWIDTLGRERVYTFANPGGGTYISLSHLTAAINGFTWANSYPASPTKVQVPDMTGWAGDLVQTFADFHAYKVENPEADAHNFARQWIGGFKGQYDDSDYEADVAAVNIAWLLANGGQTTVAGAFRSYFTGPEYAVRHAVYLDRRFSGSLGNALEMAIDIWESDITLVQAMRGGILLADFVSEPDIKQFIPDISQAWADVLRDKIQG